MTKAKIFFYFRWAVILFFVGDLIKNLLRIDYIGLHYYSMDDLHHFLVIGGVCIGLTALAWYLRFRSFILTIIFCFILAGLRKGPLTSLSVLAIYMSSFSLGSLTFQLLRIPRRDWFVELVLKTTLGILFIGWVMNFVVPYPINYAWTYSLLLALPCIVWFFSSAGRGLSLKLKIKELFISGKRERKLNFEIVFILLINFVVLVQFVHFYLPDMGFDSLAYHLVPMDFIRHNSFWAFDPVKYSWTFFPFTADWLYALAHLLGGEFAVRLFNLSVGWLGVLLLFLIIDILSEYVWALCAALLYISLPLFAAESVSAFIDHFVNLVALGSLLSFILFYYDQQRLRPLAFVSAIFLGIGLTIKSTMFFWVGPMLFLWWLQVFRNDYRSFRDIILMSLLVFVLGSVCYVRAYIYTGNPVFPFFNGIFKSKYFHSASSFTNSLFHVKWSPKILHDIVFESSRFLESDTGSAGFYLLLLFPAILVSVSLKHKRLYCGLLALLLLFCFGVFSFQAYLRYVFPMFPLVIIIWAMSLGREMWGRFYKKFWLAMALFLSLLGIWFTPSAYFMLRGVPPLFSRSDYDRLDENWVPERKLNQSINAKYDNQARVFLLTRPYPAGLWGVGFANTWHSAMIANEAGQVRNLVQIKSFLQKWCITQIVYFFDIKSDPIEFREYLSQFQPEATLNGFSYLSTGIDFKTCQPIEE